VDDVIQPDRQRHPTKRSFTVSWSRHLSLLTILSLTLSGQCLAQDNKDDAKPKGAKPAPKITVSQETTWATEPLRDDGTVNYIAVINRHFSKDVTPENNACVLLYQTMGPSPEGKRQPDQFFRRMGIEPLPDEGNYFQGFNDWLRNHPDVKVDGSIYDILTTACERPWKRDEFPVIANWLKDNQLPLQTLAEVTERPRYFSPVVWTDANPDGAALITIVLPGVHRLREMARALAARAMWELAEGSQFDAWHDLMTVHRLGRLVGQGPSTIEYLVGNSIESMALIGEQRLLSEKKPSAKLLAMYRKQLGRLPPRASISDKVDICERVTFLDCAQRVASGKMRLQQLMQLMDDLEKGDRALFANLDEGTILDFVDWDVVLKAGNKWYDRLAETARISDYQVRAAVLKQLNEDLKKLVEKSRGPMVLLSLHAGKPAITQTMSDLFISLFVPALQSAIASEGRTIQRMRNLELAFALEMWRVENNSYPDSLEKLVPKQIADVPNDLFNGKPLKYERTTEGYRFYSVGQNGQDDEGRSFDDHPKGDDLVIRMPMPPPKAAK
jgi:hypothetical protein